MARGKKKKGRDMSAVSGPGALARRTDVPAYASPEGERPYGERQAVESQAAAMPMADQRLAQRVQQGVFAPTDRPNEPATAGAPFGPGRTPMNPVPPDPDALLRAMIEVNPHPALFRLLLHG